MEELPILFLTHDCPACITLCEQINITQTRGAHALPRQNIIVLLVPTDSPHSTSEADALGEADFWDVDTYPSLVLVDTNTVIVGRKLIVQAMKDHGWFTPAGG